MAGLLARGSYAAFPIAQWLFGAWLVAYSCGAATASDEQVHTVFPINPQRGGTIECNSMLDAEFVKQLWVNSPNAYANKVGYEADLTYKTRRLIQENATQDGLGHLIKSVTFDLKTLEALRGEKGSDEGKVFNLVRGLQKEIDYDPNAAPVLQPLKDRAERILRDLESRKTTGLAAMDLMAALATEREAAAKAAKETGLSSKAFGVFWLLRNEAALKSAGVDPMEQYHQTHPLNRGRGGRGFVTINPGDAGLASEGGHLHSTTLEEGDMLSP
jgi:hypothetical protein